MQFRIVSGPSFFVGLARAPADTTGRRSPIAQRGVMRVAPCILVEPGSVMLWPSKFIRWKKLNYISGGRVRARF
jgi:hypothetical protein